MTIHICTSENELWESALKTTVQIIQEALHARGNATLGLAGGSTPKKLYEILAQENLPWEKITFVLIDERHVPRSDEESNARMLHETLFGPAEIPSRNQILFDTTLPPDEAAKKMSEKIDGFHFDLLILGAGKDGHIASLFEGDSNLESTELVYATEAPADYKTTQRLTLSLTALTRSTKALLLLKGAEKKPVVEALEGAATLKLTALKKLTEKVSTEVLVCLE